MQGPSKQGVVLLFLSLFVLSGCAGSGIASKPGRVSILAINDVYRISGVDEGRSGGLARVRTLRSDLEAAGHDVLVLHAGDFLYPSLLSREFDGEQMIDVLNQLDGQKGAFDDKLIVTFGNHEFDKADLRHAPQLQNRIEESEFAWLGTNIVFANDTNGQTLVGSGNLKNSILQDVGGTKIGIFSLTTDKKKPAYIERFDDPVEVAKENIQSLRSQGANIVVALTHQEMSQDEFLLRQLGRAGPDLVVGGHEHNRQTSKIMGRKVVKADADARSAAIIEIEERRWGRPKVEVRFVDLDQTVGEDAAVKATAQAWQEDFNQKYCTKIGASSDCLDKPIGKTNVELVAEELEIRRFETNLGNWIADQALTAFAGQGAQLSFVNSGGLRINQNIPAGANLTERHLAEIFAYPSPMSLIEIDGKTLKILLEHAVEDWTGNGWWLQIAGIAYRADPVAGTVTDITLLAPEGARPIDMNETLLAVTNDFLLDPKGGQDGYTMIGPANRVTSAGSGPDLRDLVRASVKNVGAAGISPTVEGRICIQQRPGPCLAVSAP